MKSKSNLMTSVRTESRRVMTKVNTCLRQSYLGRQYASGRNTLLTAILNKAQGPLRERAPIKTDYIFAYERPSYSIAQLLYASAEREHTLRLLNQARRDNYIKACPVQRPYN